MLRFTFHTNMRTTTLCCWSLVSAWALFDKHVRREGESVRNVVTSA